MHHLIGHPNIIKIKEVYEDIDFVHIIMELCSGGNLYQAIMKTRRYTERMVAAYVRNIVQVRDAVFASLLLKCKERGDFCMSVEPEESCSLELPLPKCVGKVLVHCRSMGVVHRDIKPENFLLQEESLDANLKVDMLTESLHMQLSTSAQFPQPMDR